jgi:thiol:disulfide interchange protein DsbD
MNPIVRMARGLSAALAALTMSTGIAAAQLGGGAMPAAKDLVQITAAPVSIAAGGTAAVAVKLTIRDGWHVNANPPAQDYMIATTVKLTAEDGITAGKTTYPAGKKEKLAIDEQPLLVYTHEAVVTVPITAAASTTSGAHELHGTVQFQSCNDQVCLAPATISFQVAVTVSAGAGGGPAPTTGAATANDTSAATPPAPGGPSGAAPGTGFATAPPAGTSSGAAPNKATGSLAFFLGLFLSGLALNLTPCVYPMLGVTVSIFGSRKGGSPAQVFGLAILYVLGMATMYTSLGVAAAFSGGLFGGLLQNPLVLGAIGVLFVGLSLSMFGLYSLQPPPWLLERLGGTGGTSAVGTFLSGLVVGVFAAPCIGPPVVALLALVGAKGDPWYGFTTFFTLAMGLGAPYLVLGTFSGLLSRLPRSGAWLMWVERMFGVVLFSIGAFYLLLGFAPKYAVWVPPVALIAGGVFLGFVEKSAASRPGFRRFQRTAGVLAVIAGVAFIATTPSRGVVFAEFNDQAFASSLKSGSPVVLDFTANWCAPCHELERLTFSDRRVRDAMRSFHAYRVDLTHYDSPEAERWRRDYQIHGVPTVLFLAPDGREVPGVRVEGFLAPAEFLQRVQRASGAQAAAR